MGFLASGEANFTSWKNKEVCSCEDRTNRTCQQQWLRQACSLARALNSLLFASIEPPHDKTNKMACAPSEDSDQPGHPPNLIRVFAVRMKKAQVLSYPLSTQWKLWSNCRDAQAEATLIWKKKLQSKSPISGLNGLIFLFEGSLRAQYLGDNWIQNCCLGRYIFGFMTRRRKKKFLTVKPMMYCPKWKFWIWLSPF